jgi:hypothetical protein
VGKERQTENEEEAGPMKRGVKLNVKEEMG